ncbi:MAG: Eco57I restriction-modification methylase domain-containing protein [Candidatus Hodarchaeales archaeon]|jgi:hypothetical protein
MTLQLIKQFEKQFLDFYKHLCDSFGTLTNKIKITLLQLLFDLLILFLFAERGVFLNKNTKKTLNGIDLLTIILKSPHIDIITFSLFSELALNPNNDLYDSNKYIDSIFVIGIEKNIRPNTHFANLTPNIKSIINCADWRIFIEIFSNLSCVTSKNQIKPNSKNKKTYFGLLTSNLLSYLFEKHLIPQFELKKESGIYYTPEDLTNYLCKQTIFTYLFENIDDSRKSEVFFNLKHLDKISKLDVSNENKQILNKRLKSIRILDPACGSGHFLLNSIFLLYELTPKFNSCENCKDTIMRAQICQNNIFGVDIMAEAINITRIRMCLWILSKWKYPEPVPIFTLNLKTGNSILGFTSHNQIPNTLLSKFNEMKEIIAERLNSNQQELMDKIDDIYLRSYKGPKINNEGKLFHWPLEFPDIFLNTHESGFDIILSNPPFGNLLNNKEKELLKLHNWVSCSVNEVCGNFLELQTYLLKEGGFLGNVIAGSILVNRYITPVRIFLKQRFQLYLSYFGTRPAKIFPIEIRIGTALGKKHNSKYGKIQTTRAIFFTKEDRQNLFYGLEYADTSGLELGEFIGDNMYSLTMFPKIGSIKASKILKKLKERSKDRLIANAFNNEGIRIEVRTTGGYWLNALPEFPYKSSKIRSFYIPTSEEAEFIVILLNSSLFYFYWTVYSNLRDVPISLIKSFPIPQFKDLIPHKKEIHELFLRLINSLLKNFDKERGRIGEFRTKLSKNIIDEIDQFIGHYFYNLTDEEITFILNYDNHIRSNNSV